MNELVEMLQNMSPNEQAVLAGVIVSALVGVLRKIVPAWFANTDNVAKFRRMVNVAILSAITALLFCWSGGVSIGCFVIKWILVFGGSQTTHVVVKNTAKAVNVGNAGTG